jgi:hypothetical protein
MNSPGVLETVMIDVPEAATKEPLWRALQIAWHADKKAAIIDALPREVALQAITELFERGATYELQVPWRSKLLEDIGEGERDWAIARADAYPVGPRDEMAFFKMYIFRALVRSKVRIEPKWDHLFPNVTGASFELILECARGLPDDRRVEVLGKIFHELGVAVHIVNAMPSEELVTAFLKSSEVGSSSFANNLMFMKQLAAKHDGARKAVEAFVATMPKPIALVVTSIVKPQSADELSPIAKEQLRIAGKGYDEQDLDAEARLADDGEETSFRGSFEVRTIADAAGKPAYDMLVYNVDSGSIFEAGTTREIGGIAQGGVVLTKANEPLRAALQAALLTKKVKTPKAPKTQTQTRKKTTVKAKAKTQAKPKAKTQAKPNAKRSKR